MTKNELAKMIDQTLLKPNVTQEELRTFCETAAQYGFRSVAINSAAVPFCHKVLEGSGVLCDATVGFPLGQCTIGTKVFEAREAIANGAGEIDYVVNLVELKSGNWQYVEEEMSRIVAECKANGVGSKVIFENCYLTNEEKEHLCQIARRVQPAFVKTSTGFGTPAQGVPAGATLEDVVLMKRCVGGSVQVKASGGVRTTQQALAMIGAGASRIGTSCGVDIINGLAE